MVQTTVLRPLVLPLTGMNRHSSSQRNMMLFLMAVLFPFSIVPMSAAAAWSILPKTIGNEFFHVLPNNKCVTNNYNNHYYNRWKGLMPLSSTKKNEDGEDMRFHGLSNALNEIEEDFSQIMMEDEEIQHKDNDDEDIIDISNELKEFKKDYFSQQEEEEEESQKKERKKNPKKTNRSKREIKTYTHILHQRVEELLQKGLVDEAIEKAEDNIETLQSLYWKTDIRWFKPTIHTYNVYIRAVSQKQPNGPQRAELILKTLPIPPNVGTYTIVISALASAHATNDYKNKKKNSNAAEKAQTLLYELMDLMQQQDQDSKSTEAKLQGSEENEDEEGDKDVEANQKRDSFIPEGDLSVACDAGNFFLLISNYKFYSNV